MASQEIDTDVPHQARIWNHWLGGKDNYPIDRQVGDQVRAVFPEIADIARHSRAFLARAVRFLAEEHGVRQFLDVGTGLPTSPNTHEIAQAHAPDSTVVYVDNDPLVLVHARALLTSGPGKGTTTYIDADVRDPRRLLEQAGAHLDLSRPVALMLLGVMGNVADQDDPPTIVAGLVDALAPGSWLVLNDGTDVLGRQPGPAPDETARAAAITLYVQAGAHRYYARTPEYLSRFFEGLTLVEPGIVSTPLWRPEPTQVGLPRPVDAFAGVALKP
ncbi:SAM-dependent methyltransferase [Actinomadura harenae]|uniref:SAM-dependent methyltransferase n=1 Tax=Actinomadura harenae TaxID=2483351 RepID=A0A3M2LTS8_9ACTN|nr:SAM-dependent methyltransferase [Actinomadura harenae]RMI39963.1 SAM-dependent methyltransferase [Actinomadura harenae]